MENGHDHEEHHHVHLKDALRAPLSQDPLVNQPNGGPFQVILPSRKYEGDYDEDRVPMHPVSPWQWTPGQKAFEHECDGGKGHVEKSIFQELSVAASSNQSVEKQQCVENGENISDDDVFLRTFENEDAIVVDLDEAASKLEGMKLEDLVGNQEPEVLFAPVHHESEEPLSIEVDLKSESPIVASEPQLADESAMKNHDEKLPADVLHDHDYAKNVIAAAESGSELNPKVASGFSEIIKDTENHLNADNNSGAEIAGNLTSICIPEVVKDDRVHVSAKVDCNNGGGVEGDATNIGVSEVIKDGPDKSLMEAKKNGETAGDLAKNIIVAEPEVKVGRFMFVNDHPLKLENSAATHPYQNGEAANFVDEKSQHPHERKKLTIGEKIRNWFLGVPSGNQ